MGEDNTEISGSKFPNGVILGKNLVSINQKSRLELTNSEYSQTLRENDPALYSDKLLSANDGWVSESLNHERKDNIVDISRGKVLLGIGDRHYSADVLLATKSNEMMLLYDILRLDSTTFTKKEVCPVVSGHQSPEAASHTEQTSDMIIGQNNQIVNKKSDGSASVDYDAASQSRQQALSRNAFDFSRTEPAENESYCKMTVGNRKRERELSVLCGMLAASF
jgi:hypothetical protein